MNENRFKKIVQKAKIAFVSPHRDKNYLYYEDEYGDQIQYNTKKHYSYLALRSVINRKGEPVQYYSKWDNAYHQAWFWCRYSLTEDGSKINVFMAGENYEITFNEFKKICAGKKSYIYEDEVEQYEQNHKKQLKIREAKLKLDKLEEDFE